MQRITFVFFATFLFASAANAELLITNRASLLSTTIDFGYVGNVTTSTDALVYPNIDDAQLVRQGNATDSGPLGDIIWDATYQYSVEQELVPGTSTGFGGHASMSLFSAIGGDGVSLLSSINRLAVEFENTTPTALRVTFIGTDTSHLELEKLTSPGVWESVGGISGGGGEIVSTLPIDAGSFRITAETFASTENSSNNGGSWSYSVAAVPEPSTIWLAVAALPLMPFVRRQLRRRRALLFARKHVSE